jgi:hypothetical protein
MDLFATNKVGGGYSSLYRLSIFSESFSTDAQRLGGVDEVMVGDLQVIGDGLSFNLCERRGPSKKRTTPHAQTKWSTPL